jgi:hypothetical protein
MDAISGAHVTRYDAGVVELVRCKRQHSKAGMSHDQRWTHGSASSLMPVMRSCVAPLHRMVTRRHRLAHSK